MPKSSIGCPEVRVNGVIFKNCLISIDYSFEVKGKSMFYISRNIAKFLPNVRMNSGISELTKLAQT